MMRPSTKIITEGLGRSYNGLAYIFVIKHRFCCFFGLFQNIGNIGMFARLANQIKPTGVDIIWNRLALTNSDVKIITEYARQSRPIFWVWRPNSIEPAPQALFINFCPNRQFALCNQMPLPLADIDLSLI